MALLNLNTLELTSTLRRAPANGAPSSQDFNDGEQEKLVDLAAMADVFNDVIRPILNALPEAAGQGLEGRTLLTDTTDQDALFYDALAGQALTVADSIRLLSGVLTSLKGQLTDVRVEVGQLSSRLASTKQNDIALAFQNISTTLTQIQNDQRTLESRIAALES